MLNAPEELQKGITNVRRKKLFPSCRSFNGKWGTINIPWWELYIRYCQVCLLYTWLIKVSPMKEKGIKSIPQVYWLSNHNGNVLHIKI